MSVFLLQNVTLNSIELIFSSLKMIFKFSHMSMFSHGNDFLKAHFVLLLIITGFIKIN